MAEPLTVVLLTYERTDYALRTVEGVAKHLNYPGFEWYISDDGSREEHVRAVIDQLGRLGQNFNIQTHWHNQRLSYGSGANRALEMAFRSGNLVLMLEDDWYLERPLDLWSYCCLLMERPDIGMVRMGYLNSGVGAVSMSHGGRVYWALDDTHSRNYSSFAFAGHPAIMHRRFFEHHGMYPERWQPGETELKMCWQCVSGMGPKIVWPAELGEHGPWGHIGEQQSYTWNGGVPL
jgi:hypothetical protein